MENINKPKKELGRCQSSQRLKFKEINCTNELNSKFGIYRKGTPNEFVKEIDQMKVANIKNQMQSFQLPPLEFIIASVSESEKGRVANLRDFNLFPSTLKKKTGNYKEMLSEKQEIKDFVGWFEEQYQSINNSNRCGIDKFNDSQTLFTTGFSEMLNHFSSVSKNRSEILKMLWNRSNQEISKILQTLSSQNVKSQKNLLESLSVTHKEYQNEIFKLTNENKQLKQMYETENSFSKSCVVTLRNNHKKIKKLEFLVKKLTQKNSGLRHENLNLMEENNKLLMNFKQITKQEALVLQLRNLQVCKQRTHLPHKSKKDNLQIKSLLNLKEKLSFDQIQIKKSILFDYFKQRIIENPDEKILFSEDQLFDQDFQQIQQEFQEVLNRPIIVKEINKPIHKTMYIQNKGVNTNIPDEQLKTCQSQKGIQVNFQDYIDNEQRELNFLFNDHKRNQFLLNKSKSLIEGYQNDKKTLLMILELNSNSKKILSLKLPKMSENHVQLESQQVSKNNKKQSVSKFYLENILQKSLQKIQQKNTVVNIQKQLGKFVKNLFKEASSNQKINIFKATLEATCSNKSNLKVSLKNYIEVGTLIRNNQKSCKLMEVLSLLLKINPKYSDYDQVNQEDISCLFFRLFFFLNKNQEKTVNIWNASTSIKQLKKLKLLQILESFLSQQKRNVIASKLEELVCMNEMGYEQCSKQNWVYQSAQGDHPALIRLHNVLLYTLEFYLVQKKNYFDSYCHIIDMLSDGQFLSLKSINMVLKVTGYDQSSISSMLQTYKLQGKIVKDEFYRMCLYFGFPLFEEVLKNVFKRFEQFDSEKCSQYSQLFEQNSWNFIKNKLINKLNERTQESISSYGILILETVDNQLKQTTGYFSANLTPEQSSGKQMAFSVLTKWIILEIL